MFSPRTGHQRLTTHSDESNPLGGDSSGDADDIVTVSFDGIEQGGSAGARSRGTSVEQIDSLLQQKNANIFDRFFVECYSFLYINHPRLFGILSGMLLVGIPLLAWIIVLLSDEADGGGGDDTLSQMTSDDVATWQEFYASTYNSVRGSGAVATDVGECSQIGVDILSKGGNAVDAAIAAAFCVGILSPASSGIGGGCFILHYNSTSTESQFIDSREFAPTGATYDMYVNDSTLAINGGLAIAVLGETAGLYKAWLEHGSANVQETHTGCTTAGGVSWSDLVTPAAEMAKEWTLSAQTVKYLNLDAVAPFLYSGEYPLLSALYLDKKGNIKGVGDTVKQPELSATLFNIADKGPSYLYEDMADILSAEIIAAGGIVTGDDIRSYAPEVSDTLETITMGHKYVGIAGSSSGGAAVIGVLNFLDAVAANVQPLASMGSGYYHWVTEAFKHVFAMRLSLGDPDYVDISGPQSALLSDDYMGSLQRNSSAWGVLPLGVYGGLYNIGNAPGAQVEDKGTTHLSTVDSCGNAVALTSTINTHFGSKVISPSTGILFNNQMDDFSVPGAVNYFGLAPSPYNYPAPHKKPLSSMSPSLVLRPLDDASGENWALRLVGGGSGGPRIITSTAQIIANVIGRGMSLLDAFKSPRLHSQLLADYVAVENQTVLSGIHIELSAVTVDLLRSLGHNNVTATDNVAINQFISIDPDTGLVEAVSDPRKDGRPAAVS